MKVSLHKPQREAANAVLAYEDEDENNYSYEYNVHFSAHHLCNTATKSCQPKYNAGDCFEYGIVDVINGVEFITPQGCGDPTPDG